MTHSTSKHVAFDLLGWRLSFSHKLLESLFDLLVVMHDIFKNQIDETHLLLEQLDSSSTCEVLPIFIVPADGGLQCLDDAYSYADTRVEGGAVPQVVEARHQIIHPHTSSKWLSKHFAECVQC